MGYSNDSKQVRVDFFKESGKWGYTEAVEWTGQYRDSQVAREFALSLRNHLLQDDGHILNHSGMIAVCLEPYHENAYPLMLRVDDLFNPAFDERKGY